MDNTEHTHRFKVSEGIGSLAVGGFALFIAIGTLIRTLQDILSGTFKFFDYLEFTVLILLLILLGLLGLVFPFMTKVVVKVHGLEYYTPTYILFADWTHLVNMGYRKNTPAGKTLVLAPREGKLKLRSWLMPFQKILLRNPSDVQKVRILIAQFGAANGHSLETDILVNVSQRAESSNELER